MPSKYLEKLAKAEGAYLGRDIPSAYDSTILTPSPSFNWALGGKGFCFGRVPLFFGPESSGKTLQAILILAEIQRQDPTAEGIFISAEFSFIKEWAFSLGVDPDRFLLRETNKPNEIFDWIANDVAEQCRQGANIRFVGVDSVKSIKGPKEQNLKDSEDHIMGDLAGYLPKAFKLIVEPIRRHKILTVLIQQVSEEMDQIKKKFDPYKIPNGKALHHFADYYCLFEKMLGKKNKLFDEEIEIGGRKLQRGHRVKVTIKKNRLGPPDRVGEFDLDYTQGVINQHEEIANMAVGLRIIQRVNNLVYAYGEKQWNGINNLIEEVKADQTFQTELYTRILQNA